MNSEYIMMDRVRIYENCDKYRAYPEPDEVLLSDFEKENLLPFGILKVNVDNVVHEVLIAAPIADEEGLIGKEEIGEFCGGEWLTYSKRDGKRQEIRRSYNERKAEYLQNKCFLNWEDKTKAPIFGFGGCECTISWAWYSRIKGHISCRLEDIPGQEDQKEKKVTLVGDDGCDYLWLGTVNASVYSSRLPQDVRIFYNPMSKRVLVIYDYT